MLKNLVVKWEKVLFCVNYYKIDSNPLIMIGFLGEFEATLDAKGRFLLPAGLQKAAAGRGSAPLCYQQGI